MSIDDVADREHACDVLLDPNRPSQACPGARLPDGGRILSGPRYAPLSEAHRLRRPANQPREGPAGHVLVSYGGVDPHDELARALRVLERPAFRHLTVDAVAASERHALDLANASARSGLRVLPPQRDLAALMAGADIALGAGGSASWERCAAGLPSVVTALAENQLAPVRVLEAAGAGLFAGTTGAVSDADLAFALSRLVDDTALFEAVSQRAWRLTDAEGARRVAAALLPDLPEALGLRAVGPEDLLLLYHWANDPDTRRNAIDQRTIRWDEHVRWFARKRAAAGTRFDLLVTPDGLPVGQLRIEPEGESAGIVHFSVEPALRGHGYGRRLLQLAVATWREAGRGGALMADVRAANQPSRRAFSAAGFRIERTIKGDILRYRHDPGQGAP
jgi:spore coat polysaccharide biosynthesis predicted glycosyltransferase SpsG/GNAT superfamily N-acetyltransferase